MYSGVVNESGMFRRRRRFSSSTGNLSNGWIDRCSSRLWRGVGIVSMLPEETILSKSQRRVIERTSKLPPREKDKRRGHTIYLFSSSSPLSTLPRVRSNTSKSQALPHSSQSGTPRMSHSGSFWLTLTGPVSHRCPRTVPRSIIPVFHHDTDPPTCCSYIY